MSESALPMVFAGIGVSLSLLGSLATMLAMVWKTSGLVTSLKQSLEANRESTAKLESRLEVLDTIPLLEMNITALKDTVSKTTSLIPKLDSRIAVIESRVNSIKEWRRPASLSRPDPGEIE